MKAAELRDMKPLELNKKLSELKQELFNLRFQHAINQLDNPQRIVVVRREIARVKTVMHELHLTETVVKVDIPAAAPVQEAAEEEKKPARKAAARKPAAKKAAPAKEEADAEAKPEKKPAAKKPAPKKAAPKAEKPAAAQEAKEEGAAE